MKITKTVTVAGLVVTAGLFLSSCGKLSGKKELLRYSEENFGESTVIGYDSSEDKNTLTLCDKEYGFEYEVSSGMFQVGMDGTTFWNSAALNSDFSEKYLRNFEDIYSEQINNAEEKYRCDIETNEFYNPKSDNDICFYLTLDFDEYQDALNDLVSWVNEYDTRNYFANGAIYVKNGEDWLGEYLFDDGIFKNRGEAECEWALTSAAMVMRNTMGIKVSGPEELSFQYLEEMDVNDIYGINNVTLAYRTDDTPESLKHTKVWHYSYNDEEWIVADCITSPDGNLYVCKLK